MIAKPSGGKAGRRPARYGYLAAAGDRGAKDVLTHAGTLSQAGLALRASSPAAISRRGSDVFVQLVIAANPTGNRGRLVDGLVSKLCVIWARACGTSE